MQLFGVGSYESFPPTIKRKRLFKEELFFLSKAFNDECVKAGSGDRRILCDDKPFVA
ncbi:MAG: hypothetical protein Rhims3KO_10810 [Hyphomicrobiales bacterium]